jgi:hypothetical protein
MLKPNQPNGYDVIKMSWIGVKASISFPPSHPAPWMAQANDNYSSTIVPARSQKDALGGLGIKVQTQAAQRIEKELAQLFTARKTNPQASERAEQQHAYVRTMLDKVTFSANTPAKLSAALAQMQAHFASMDPQVAGFLSHHCAQLAAMPQQHTPFELTHTSLDDKDKQQMTALGAQFTPTQTSGYGTVLAHQPQLVGGENWGKGLSVQGKTTLDMDNVKTFDGNALSHEMNSVNGPSGSTNIMSFLYLQLQKENPSINLQDAFAGTMMFLTFDGGHSLPESVGTFKAITSDTRATQVGGKPVAEHGQIMAQRRQILENNVLAYGQLGQLFTNAQTSAAVDGAVSRAWERTHQSFDQLHQQRTQTTA